MRNEMKLTIKELTVRTMMVNGVDYICITDIAKQKNPHEPKDVVKNWMRLKNTLEYLGLWEMLNNPAFKGVEFDPLLKDAGTNAFTNEPFQVDRTYRCNWIVNKEWERRWNLCTERHCI